MLAKMGILYSVMCCRCCATRMPAHGRLLCSFPKGSGLGRLDHCSLEKAVRQDVVDLLVQDFLGYDGMPQHQVMDWVFGKVLDGAQKSVYATYLAKLIWEECVDFCGGIALGMRHHDGTLGAVAFLVPMEPNQRRVVGLAATRNLIKHRFWMIRWRQLGGARVGVQKRTKCFHDVRLEHLSQKGLQHLPGESVLSLRLLAGRPSASGDGLEDIKNSMSKAVCYYADQRGYTLVCHAVRQETIDLFQHLGFHERSKQQAIPDDPEKSQPLEIADMYRKVQWPPTRLD